MTGDLPVPRAPASVLDGLTPGQRRAAIRHLIENLGGRLKECRSVATRYEKTAASFLFVATADYITDYSQIGITRSHGVSGTAWWFFRDDSNGTESSQLSLRSRWSSMCRLIVVRSQLSHMAQGS